MARLPPQGDEPLPAGTDLSMEQFSTILERLGAGVKEADANDAVKDSKGAGVLFEMLSTLESCTGSTDQTVLVQVLDTAVRVLMQVLMPPVGSGPGRPATEMVGKSLAIMIRRTLHDPVSWKNINHISDTLLSHIGGGKQNAGVNATPQSRAACIRVAAMLVYEFPAKFPVHDHLKELGRVIKANATATPVRTAAFEALATIVPTQTSFPKPLLGHLTRGAGDRAPEVKIAMAACTVPFARRSKNLLTTDVDSVVSLLIRNLGDSSDSVRRASGRALGEFLVLVADHAGNPGIGRKSDGGKGGDKSESGLRNKASSLGGAVTRRRYSPTTDLLVPVQHLVHAFCKANASRELRVGIGYALSSYFSHLKVRDLIANLSDVVPALFSMLGKKKSFSNAHDTLHARRVTAMVFEAIRTLPRVSEELLQKMATELAGFLTRRSNIVAEKAGDDVVQLGGVTEHILSVTLVETSALITALGEAAAAVSEPVMDALMLSLAHRNESVRIGAACCLRALSVAVPAQLASMCTACLHMVSMHKVELLSDPKQTSREAQSAMISTHGHASALAALVSVVGSSANGVPSSLLSAALDEAAIIVAPDHDKGGDGGLPPLNSTSIHRVTSGWALIAGLMNLGPEWVGARLTLLFSLWKSALGAKSFKDSPQSGEALQLALRYRAGALMSLHLFIKCCPTLVQSSKIQKPVVLFLSHALHSVSSLPKDTTVPELAPYHASLFAAFRLLPPAGYATCIPPLLRLAVNQFCGTGVSQATTLLVDRLDDADQVLDIDILTGEPSEGDIVQSPSLPGSFTQDFVWSPDMTLTVKPRAPTIITIDEAILLFDALWPHQSLENRQRLLDHFVSSVQLVQGGRSSTHTTAKRQVLLSNLLTALLYAFNDGVNPPSTPVPEKGTAEALVKMITTAKEVVQAALSDPDMNLRRAAAQCFGRLFTGRGGEGLVAGIVKSVTDQLRVPRHAAREALTLTLGRIYHAVGSLRGGDHLRLTMGALHALAREPEPSMQLCALHSLSGVIATAGLSCSQFIGRTLALVTQLLMSHAHGNPGTYHCLAKIINSIAFILGPELDASNPANILHKCLRLHYQFRSDARPRVVEECVGFVERIILFAPKVLAHFDQFPFLEQLDAALSHQDGDVRQSALTCLSELHQRGHCGEYFAADDLPIRLIRLFNTEEREGTRNSIKTLLFRLASQFAQQHTGHWVTLAKTVLMTAGDDTPKQGDDDQARAGKVDEPEDLGGSDDEEEREAAAEAAARAAEENAKAQRYGIQGVPSWRTRLLAARLMKHVLEVMDSPKTDKTHFDLVAARKQRKPTDYLVLRISDVASAAFAAGTHQYPPLRPVGLLIMGHLLRLFAGVEDPDVEGQLLIENVNAQVSSCLRSGLAIESTPEVIAPACALVPPYLRGSPMFCQDTVAVKRVLAVMDKCLENTESGVARDGEHAVTRVRLSVLTAFAEVADLARRPENASLAPLVAPRLESLRDQWLRVITDCFVLNSQGKAVLKSYKSPGQLFVYATAHKVRPMFAESWRAVLTPLSAVLAGQLQSGKGEATAANSFAVFGFAMHAATTHLRRADLGHREESLRVCVSVMDRLFVPELFLAPFIDDAVMCEVARLLLSVAITSYDTSKTSPAPIAAAVLGRMIPKLKDFFKGTIPVSIASAFTEAVVFPTSACLPAASAPSITNCALLASVLSGDDKNAGRHLLSIAALARGVANGVKPEYHADDTAVSTALTKALPTVITSLLASQDEKVRGLVIPLLQGVVANSQKAIQSGVASVTSVIATGIATLWRQAANAEGSGLPSDVDRTPLHTALASAFDLLDTAFDSETATIADGAVRACAVLIGTSRQTAASEHAVSRMLHHRTLQLLPRLASHIRTVAQVALSTDTSRASALDAGLRILIASQADALVAQHAGTTTLWLALETCLRILESSDAELVALKTFASQAMLQAGQGPFAPAFKQFVATLNATEKATLQTALQAAMGTPAAGAGARGGTGKPGGAVSAAPARPAAPPSIKLKMDFSNFGKK